jgi:hypothetical protein
MEKEGQDRASAAGDPHVAPGRRGTRFSEAATFGLHPFLFAAAPVFALYASNLGQLSFSDVAGALAACVAAALVLFLAFGGVLRRLRSKAAILASIVVVTGLFYQKIISAIGFGDDSVIALPVTLAIMSFLMILVARLPVDLSWANTVLNGVAIAVLITPAWQVAVHEWKAGAWPTITADTIDDAQAQVASRSLPLAPLARNSPDIYYFIFDRYASQAALSKYYGFDNTDLIDFLKGRGFYVASNSHSNYLKTAPSLASTFHMDYLDRLAKDDRSKPGEWRPIFAMLKEHRVARFLKSRGYKFIQIGAWWGPTQRNDYADESYSFAYGEFDHRYLRKTIVPPILHAIVPASTYARRLNWDDGQCQRVPRQIEKVKEIAGGRETTQFVFTHLLVPHLPYVFDPQGRCLSQAEDWERGTRQGYVQQVQYANSLIKDIVSTLLSKKGTKPIIIIQADEGPFPERYEWSNRSWHEATFDELNLKTSILNAYYFPDGDYRSLYQHVSPVNTFRILFNKYFDTHLKLLTDRIYAFSDNFTIYDFFDITDIVTGASTNGCPHATCP